MAETRKNLEDYERERRLKNRNNYPLPKGWPIQIGDYDYDFSTGKYSNEKEDVSLSELKKRGLFKSNDPERLLKQFRTTS